MKWEETVASQCRYGDNAEVIWGDWDILWEDSEADYQGHASFFAEKDGKFCFYEWWYGSCSGCDGWAADELTDEQIEKEMQETALWLDSKEEVLKWLEMLDRGKISNYNMERGGALAAGLDILSGGLRKRLNSIRQHFGLPELD